MRDVKRECVCDCTRCRLTLTHTHTLKLAEDVLGVCHSPNGRLLAVALLDSTIKVFFRDTLKVPCLASSQTVISITV